MDKLGSWITMQHGLVVDGGNKAMHSVNSGVRFTSKSSAARMMVETIDAGIVVFGEPTGFPTQGPYGNQEPDLSKGVSSMLHNNLWGTNVRSSCRSLIQLLACAIVVLLWSCTDTTLSAAMPVCDVVSIRARGLENPRDGEYPLPLRVEIRLESGPVSPCSCSIVGDEANDATGMGPTW